MKRFILSAAALLAFNVQAEEKVSKSPQVACHSYFKAVELDRLLQLDNPSVLIMFIQDKNNGCILVKEGLPYTVVRNYRDINYFFEEVYFTVDGKLVKSYLFGG